MVPTSPNSEINVLKRSTHLLIRHLTTAVGQEDFGLVTVGQKSLNLSDLDLQIMFICPWTQFNFLHMRRLLMTAVLVLLFAQLKLVFPVVHNTAHGRQRGRRDLDKIVAIFLCLFECIRREENAKLFTFRTNYSDFAHSDFPIHS